MFLSQKKNLKKNPALLIIQPDVVWLQASILCLFTTGGVTIISCGTQGKSVWSDHSKIDKTKLMYFPLSVGVLRLSLFCLALLCVHSSFAFILKRKRTLVALLLLSYRCLVTVNVLWLFLTVAWVGLQCVIVVFPDHIHLFLKINGSLMKVESIAECSLGAFCNTFDLHKAIISLGNQILGLLFWVAAQDRFYCNFIGSLSISFTNSPCLYLFELIFTS